MTEIQILVPTRRRGRPTQPALDPSLLDVLSIPQALVYARSKGRGMSRARLMGAIARGELAAFQDMRLDREGKPLLRITRKAFDAWLMATLTPFHPAALPGASS